MSREIKFKVWDNEYKEYSNWTNRDPFFSVSHGKLFFWERTQNEDGKYSGDIILEDNGDRFTLLQYTGLKDKNGVEIYEGDIVKAHPAERWGMGIDQSQYDYYLLKSPKVVLYKNLSFKLFDNNEDNSYSYYLDQHVEVIGNLYENPELLKQ